MGCVGQFHVSVLLLLAFVDLIFCLRSEGRLDFDAMDEFMSVVLNAITEHGSRAVRVFPPESGVLIAFADRIAGDVVSVRILYSRSFINSLYCRSGSTSQPFSHVRGSFLRFQVLEGPRHCSFKPRQRRSRRRGGW